MGDAPDLWYFKDTDHDGIADQRRKVLTGFGTSNVQGLLNSMRWGLDNRIHIATSSSGGRLHRPNENSDPVSIRGRDIAVDPRNGRAAPTSPSAQHGMCFDDWGRKFVSSNSDHIQQVLYDDALLTGNRFVTAPSARVSIAADGPQAEVFRTSPVEPWRIVRTELRVTGAAKGPVEGGGRASGYFTGATGVTIYRGDAWPKEHRGTAFIGDVGSNLIHRKRLTGHGLPFVAERMDANTEFLTSEDNWFRPSQFANGPDGCLYVVDTYREVIEHPKSLPPDIKAHLDLTAGRDRGRIYRIRPAGHRLRPVTAISALSATDLVVLLTHENAWHRETAARLLFERQDTRAVAALIRLLDSPQPLARLHAMYCLEGLNALSDALLLSRLTDVHPQVRLHAIQLASAAGFFRHQVSSEILQKLASDTSDDVRLQLAFAAADLPPQVKTYVLSVLLNSGDTTTLLAAAVHNAVADSALDLFLTFCDGQRKESLSDVRKSLLSSLAIQIARQNRMAEITAALSAVVDRKHLPTANRLPLMVTLTSDHPELLTPRLHNVIQDLQNELVEIVLDSTITDSQRTAAIAGLRFVPNQATTACLCRLISRKTSRSVCHAAIRTLGSLDDGSAGEKLVSLFSDVGPATRPVVISELLSRSDWTECLIAAIEAGEISSTALNPSQWQQISRTKDAALRKRIRPFIRSQTTEDVARLLTIYRPVLAVSGDASSGESLFRRHCAVCHQANRVGNAVGPNLTAMRARGRSAILVNVLDPNREVNPQYIAWTVLTTSGRTFTGIVKEETATSITLLQADGSERRLHQDDIEEFHSTGKSLMPEGFHRSLNTEQMTDLLTYLSP